ncbi:MAG: ATPase, T2SS/T4P/T4SS family [Planctomycetaceae bacterium]
MPLAMVTELTEAAPKSSFRMKLGEQLVNAGLLTEDKLEAALSEQSTKKQRLGEVLLQMGLVGEDELLPFMEQQLGIASIRLRDGVIDPQVVKLLPRAKAESLQAIAMFLVRGRLTVAMADPQNLQYVDEIERLTGFEINPVLALQSSIANMLSRVYQDDFSVDAVTADLCSESIELKPDMIDLDLTTIDSLIDGSPIVNLVNYMIVHAVRQGASDIHIEPGFKNTIVRFRVDGQLREMLNPLREFHPAIVSRLKVMGRMDIAERRIPQDGRIHLQVEGRPIDLRISSLPTVLGEKMVLRVLDRQNVTFNLDQLGVPPHQLNTIKKMIARPHGLILVTGPTGSGKTTTLYSAIELMKSVSRNIVTVEDPVEYQLEMINQVQAGSAPTMTFANVLRSILRQDPDVIMVGEIRDAETAEVAIQSALTGHLVLSTLHTNDSASAITRLLDMGVASYKVSAALVGVVAQRLLRKVCPHCQIPYYPPNDILEMIHYKGDRRRQFVRGEGCKKCFDSGHLGRIAVYEVMSVSPALREVISSTPNLDAIREIYRQQGGTTLLEEGFRRAEEGITSLDEVISVTFSE